MIFKLNLSLAMKMEHSNLQGIGIPEQVEKNKKGRDSSV
jgi:hypothetical protein